MKRCVTVHVGFDMVSLMNTSCSRSKESSPILRLQRGPRDLGARISIRIEEFPASSNLVLPCRCATWVGGTSPCAPSIHLIIRPASLVPSTSFQCIGTTLGGDDRVFSLADKRIACCPRSSSTGHGDTRGCFDANSPARETSVGP